MEDQGTRFDRAMENFKTYKSHAKMMYKINISDAPRVWNIFQGELERNWNLTTGKPNTMVIAMPLCSNK